MRKIIEKLLKVEQEMASKKGAFSLFALFLREDAEDTWDLLTAAPWIGKDKANALNFIAKRVQKALTHKEMLQLSRIVIIDEDNPALDAIHRAIHVEHGSAEIKDSVFFGLLIKHAYLITSQRLKNKKDDKPSNQRLK